MAGQGYRVLAGVIVAISIAVVVGGIYLIVDSRNDEAEQVARLPTQVVIPTATPLPTITPTNTPRPTLPGTFTPTPIPTETPTTTLTPSFTPSVTATITDTPAPTATPAQSETFTPTPMPTASNTSNVPTATPTNTRSPFPFQLRGSEVIYTSNIFNQQACAYQGIGGQVLDLQSVGINDGLKVVVVDESGRELSSESGDASSYGARGGFEVGVDTKPNRRSYFVEVRTIQTSTALSPLIEVTFPSDCDRNVALLYFEQTRPY